MNIFKTTVIIATVCIATSINARQVGQAPAQRPAQPQPMPAPVVKQPIPQPKPAPAMKQPVLQQKPAAQVPTFQNLIMSVKNASNVWDRTNNRLNSNFIDSIVRQAHAAQLDTLQLETLLKTARDIHGIFSGNQQKDIAILHSVESQIIAAINKLIAM